MASDVFTEMYQVQVTNKVNQISYQKEANLTSYHKRLGEMRSINTIFWKDIPDSTQNPIISGPQNNPLV